MHDRWLACVHQLEAEVPTQLYKTWIQPLTYLGYDESEHVLRLGAPNQFKLNWVRNQFGTRIGELAGNLIDPHATVMFEIAMPGHRPPPKPAAPIAPAAPPVPSARAPTHAPVGPDPVAPSVPSTVSHGNGSRLDPAPSTHSPIGIDVGELPAAGDPAGPAADTTRPRDLLARLAAIKPQPGGPPRQPAPAAAPLVAPGPSRAATPPPASTPTGATTLVDRTKLRVELTFDSFVAGKSNQLARAAALQVVDRPGTTYNPLFLYGGVGLGKTHLIHAVGNAILERSPTAKVRYIHAQ